MLLTSVVDVGNLRLDMQRNCKAFSGSAALQADFERDYRCRRTGVVHNELKFDSAGLRCLHEVDQSRPRYVRPPFRVPQLVGDVGLDLDSTPVPTWPGDGCGPRSRS